MHKHSLRSDRLDLSLRYASIVAILLVFAGVWTNVADAQVSEAPVSEAPVPEGQISGIEESAASVEESVLRFSFDRTPWREVIQWIADESNLALHVSDLPQGSFSYTDPGTFTRQEAIDRINLFLLPQGYTLVRNGKLLSVINLADQRSLQQLDSLAQLVSAPELETLPSNDVVKCIFPLGELIASEVVQELGGLNLMKPPTVFSRTNQLMITETVSKLRNVKRILEAFEPTTLANEVKARGFALKHVNAEDALVVLRPHLGLASGETIGIDVSLSTDLQGGNIFVTGVEEKIKLIEGLLESIDVPGQGMAADGVPPELRSYPVAGGNAETIYNVLQTLLSGKNVRLSIDSAAGSVVALATPSVQSEIAATIEQLQASDADFEVIPLKWVDPYMVIALLDDMLGLPKPGDKYPDPDAPKIDADPNRMRLFVRGKPKQIDQIKRIVAGLDVDGRDDQDHTIRSLPLKGERAERALETAATFWRNANPIILYAATKDRRIERTERVLHGESLIATKADEDSIQLPSPRVLTRTANANAPAIQCQLTPRGLVLQSEDTEALDKFEQHLRTITGPFEAMPSPPIVFYLKYAKADDALRMLGELLDGGESVKESEYASLVSGQVSRNYSGMYLGSIVVARDGTMTMMAGTITVVADSRLNRLVAQGTTEDIERIENYLKIIDKDDSIISVETHGTSQVIELEHTRASEVAAAIREAFGDRMSEPRGGAAGAVGQSESSSSKSDSSSSKTVAKTSAPKNLEPTMTVAVHEPSNSLIVTAPKSLFEEVKQLARMIDSRGEQAVQVVVPSSAAAMEAVLQSVLSGDLRSSSSRSSSSYSRSTSSSSSSRTSR